MRLSTIAAATALCLSYSAVAIHLPEREALPALSEEPHDRYGEETPSIFNSCALELYAVSDYLLTAACSDSLDKRLTIEEQVAILGAGSMVALNVNAIATYVSNLMKAQSEANTCGVISGTVDGYVLPLHLRPISKILTLYPSSLHSLMATDVVAQVSTISTMRQQQARTATLQLRPRR
jgi:hypothetical protein